MVNSLPCVTKVLNHFKKSLLLIYFSICLNGSCHMSVASKLVPVPIGKPLVFCHSTGTRLGCILGIWIGQIFWLFTSQVGQPRCEKCCRANLLLFLTTFRSDFIHLSSQIFCFAFDRTPNSIWNLQYRTKNNKNYKR